MKYSDLSNSSKKVACKELINNRDYLELNYFAVNLLCDYKMLQSIQSGAYELGFELFMDNKDDIKFVLDHYRFDYQYNPSNILEYLGELQNGEHHKIKFSFDSGLEDVLQEINDNVRNSKLLDYEEFEPVAKEIVHNKINELCKPYVHKIIEYFNGIGYTKDIINQFVKTEFYGEPFEFNADGTMVEF